MHPDARIILVIRDALDVYADSLRVGWLAMPYEIQQFIEWQNSMYEQLVSICNEFVDDSCNSVRKSM